MIFLAHVWLDRSLGIHVSDSGFPWPDVLQTDGHVVALVVDQKSGSARACLDLDAPRTAECKLAVTATASQGCGDGRKLRQFVQALGP